MPRLFKDRFTLWLEAQDICPGIYQPGGMLGYPPMGWQVTLRHCTLSYVVRPEQPDTLIVIMFERDQSRQGLGSPFADFVLFVSMVKRSGIARIQGRVLASESRPKDSLETQRMMRFYHRHLAGKDVPEGPDVVWMVGEMADLKMPLAGADDLTADAAKLRSALSRESESQNPNSSRTTAD